MDILLQEFGNNILEPASGLTERLRLAIRAGSDSQVILYSDDPEQENNELLAVLETLKEYARCNPEIVTATPYPTAEWQKRMTIAGFDRLWIASERLGRMKDPNQAQFFALEHPLCPFLHTRSDPSEQVSAPVCGVCDDRMVLAIHHLRKWCMTDPTPCPWKSGEKSNPLQSLR
ncbi:MAG: hypothetical protein HQL98_08745 [Magnetococcales bacterium]|nr:hypothetical protein [Magnetococcales bacterium]